MLKKSVENAPVVASDYVQESKINVTKCQDTQIGNRYYYNVEKINVVCSDAEKEITLDPALLTNNISSPLKTDNSSKVIVINNQKFQIQRRYVLAVAAVLVLITVTVTLAVILTTASSGNNNDDFENSSLKVVERGEWFASKRRGPVEILPVQPAPYVIIGEATGVMCTTTPACSNVVKATQNYHMSLNYSDIGYNFLIGSDGSAYEGRGWDIQGAHTLSLNNRSIGISFIGDYMINKPDKRIISVFWKLVKLGVKENKLMPNFTIFTHRQIRGSSSPGNKLYDIIKTWPQWSHYDKSKDVPPYTYFSQYISNTTQTPQ